MGIKEQITDIIVDVISEEGIMNGKSSEKVFKRGFFMERPYLISKTVLVNKNKLITEEYLLGLIKEGKKRVKIPGNIIVTPAARMLIEEGKILINE